MSSEAVVVVRPRCVKGCCHGPWCYIRERGEYVLFCLCPIRAQGVLR